MNIGMIIHSETGHTEYVAERLLKELKDKGYNVSYIKLKTEASAPKEPKKIVDNPSLKEFDTIIFCSHVEAFSLAGAMKAYLKGIEDISTKKVICMITQQFPFPWMGGNNALKQMKALIAQKGGSVISTADVNWGNEQKREGKVTDAIEAITAVV
ncbi:MAG: hypothetical protein KAQ68_05995 [Clostridiales bacterium]|nr:hypothetical protein [Clostridiales bacterium]